MDVYLVRRIDRENKLGPWGRVSADDITAAATRVLLAGCERVLVRGPEEEAVFLLADAKALTADDWRWQRGGPALCGRPCTECSEDHHFTEASASDFLDEPGHEAAKRVEAWLCCKHCSAWVAYEYGEGIEEALEDSAEEVE